MTATAGMPWCAAIEKIVGAVGVGRRRLDPGGAVQQGVLGVDVEVDEARAAAHRRCSDLLRPGFPQRSRRLWRTYSRVIREGAQRYARASEGRQGRRSRRAASSARREVVRQRLLQLDPLPRHRVVEPDPPRVQERPRRGPAPRASSPAAAVAAVPQDRMADRAQVHADLVRPAGPGRRLQQRGAGPVARGPRRPSRRRGPSPRRTTTLRAAPAERGVDRERRRARRVPRTSARYRRSTSWRRNAACSAAWVRVVGRATSISPEVPASSRCTMPPAAAARRPRTAARPCRAGGSRGCRSAAAPSGASRARPASRRRAGARPGSGSGRRRAPRRTVAVELELGPDGLAARERGTTSAARRPSTVTRPAAMARCTSARGTPSAAAHHGVQPPGLRDELSRRRHPGGAAVGRRGARARSPRPGQQDRADHDRAVGDVEDRPRT